MEVTTSVGWSTVDDVSGEIVFDIYTIQYPLRPFPTKFEILGLSLDVLDAFDVAFDLGFDPRVQVLRNAIT